MPKAGKAEMSYQCVLFNKQSLLSQWKDTTLCKRNSSKQEQIDVTLLPFLSSTSKSSTRLPLLLAS